jgi:large subunit ribosomal protein L25
MAEIRMQAQPRTVVGKKVASLRRRGIIPVVIYGGTLEAAVSAQVDERHLNDTLRLAGHTSLITIDLDGRQIVSLAREVQRDELTQRITHVDFQSVRLDRTIQTEVPVRLVGESQLIEDQLAILTHGIDTVTVEALPRNLVSHLDADLGLLKEVGDTITVADLNVPEGIEVLTDPEVVIASAQPLPTEEAIAEVEEGEGEPELVAEAETEEEAEE